MILCGRSYKAQHLFNSLYLNHFSASEISGGLDAPS